MTPVLQLEMRAFRNARYHEDREAHFQAMSRWSNFLVVVTGSSAFAGGWAAAHEVAATSGAIAAIIGAAQLAFDFGGKAGVHHHLRRQYLEIMARCKVVDAADVAALNDKMMSIYGGEPEVYHAVNALAYNAAQEAFERPKGTGLVVAWWQALLRHWFRFKPSDFKDECPPSRQDHNQWPATA